MTAACSTPFRPRLPRPCAWRSWPASSRSRPASGSAWSRSCEWRVSSSRPCCRKKSRFARLEHGSPLAAGPGCQRRLLRFSSHFPDGKLAIIVGDVTDKGVPAALVMATTRSILRSAAERLVSPGAVLEEANNRSVSRIFPPICSSPACMLLDPATGVMRYANAGHNLPFQRGKGSGRDARAGHAAGFDARDGSMKKKKPDLAPGDHYPVQRWPGRSA
jgi:hypothetical protein